jgi:DNA-binding GntR family transcriptional regulator
MANGSKAARQAAVPPPGGRLDLADAAYERLKRAIISGELAAGQDLVEASLAHWCEVSRTPIREALTRLEYDGMVVRSDRGLVVKSRSPAEILDIYEVRIALERSAARMAADRRTSNDLHALRRINQRMRSIRDPQPADMVSVNADFHPTIWQASHNACLIDLLQRLTLHLGRYPVTTLGYPGRWEIATAEHEALVDAIEQRDGDRAEALANAHFNAAREIRLKCWDQEA